MPKTKNLNCLYDFTLEISPKLSEVQFHLEIQSNNTNCPYFSHYSDCFLKKRFLKKSIKPGLGNNLPLIYFWFYFFFSELQHYNIPTLQILIQLPDISQWKPAKNYKVDGLERVDQIGPILELSITLKNLLKLTYF